MKLKNHWFWSILRKRFLKVGLMVAWRSLTFLNGLVDVYLHFCSCRFPVHCSQGQRDILSFFFFVFISFIIIIIPTYRCTPRKCPLGTPNLRGKHQTRWEKITWGVIFRKMVKKITISVNKKGIWVGRAPPLYQPNLRGNFWLYLSYVYSNQLKCLIICHI